MSPVKRMKHKVRTKITPAKRETVYSADRYSCVYCDAKGPLTIDHVVPLSVCIHRYDHPSIINHPANLLTACEKCNGERDIANNLILRYGRFRNCEVKLKAYRKQATEQLQTVASWMEAP